MLWFLFCCVAFVLLVVYKVPSRCRSLTWGSDLKMCFSSTECSEIGGMGNVILANGITEGFWHSVSAGDSEYEMRKERGMWIRNLVDLIFTNTLPFDLFSRSSSALHLFPLCSFILWTDRTGCIPTQSSWKCQKSNRRTLLSPVHQFSVRENEKNR